MRPPIARTAAACGIYSSARAARRCLRVRDCVRCDRPGSRVSAAGVTWTCRTAKAQWAVRYSHTSVVDAAGAIYVIGGHDPSNSTDLQDVYASTDGGAQPDYVTGVGRWDTQGVLEGVLRGY